MRDDVQKALDFAVAKEVEAEAFYKEWASQVTDPGAKAMFAGLAATENGHAEMLRRVHPEEIIGKNAGLEDAGGLAKYLVDVAPSASMDVQAAMILAMKREETSVALYERLAEFGGEAQALLRGLANEERRHRQRLEAEYNDHILTEN